MNKWTEFYVQGEFFVILPLALHWYLYNEWDQSLPTLTLISKKRKEQDQKQSSKDGSQLGKDVQLDASLHSLISISVALISTAAFINMNFHC